MVSQTDRNSNRGGSTPTSADRLLNALVVGLVPVRALGDTVAFNPRCSRVGLCRVFPHVSQARRSQGRVLHCRRVDAARPAGQRARVLAWLCGEQPEPDLSKPAGVHVTRAVAT
jgi:hypothetical protein